MDRGKGDERDSSSSSIKLEKRAEKELEETRKSLNQKIAELNKAIDEFSDEADVRLNAKLGRLSEELDPPPKRGAFDEDEDDE